MAFDERCAMRCLICDAEMILIKAVSDESVAVPGFERHTLQCSSCGDVEERLVFSAKSGEAGEMLMRSTPGFTNPQPGLRILTGTKSRTCCDG